MLTPLEAKLFDLLLDANAVLDKRMISGKEFGVARGCIHRGLELLENKNAGCETGLHVVECMCAEGIPLAVATIKTKRRNA